MKDSAKLQILFSQIEAICDKASQIYESWDVEAIWPEFVKKIVEDETDTLGCLAENEQEAEEWLKGELEDDFRSNE